MPAATDRHARLARPTGGKYHRHEWAILGAPCDLITQLVTELVQRLSSDLRLAYVDADHQPGQAPTVVAQGGAHLQYTDKISSHRIDQLSAPTEMDLYAHLAAADAVLVNGNHFVAARQIVILDERKRESLSRKLDRLTQVDLILFTDSSPECYPFLREHLGDDLPPIVSIHELTTVVQYLRQWLSPPPLYGLVLAGGQSQRMGQDKGLISYHGQPQRDYVYAMLNEVCEQVYLSVRPEQATSTPLATISDTFVGLGPFGAMLSAFQFDPNAAWLVVACDLPLLDVDTLAQLVAARQRSRLATAFYNGVTDWPEPLLTIWEPRAYPVLLQWLSRGYSCPRKVLINSDVAVIHPTDARVLHNVNFPYERDQLLAQGPSSDPTAQ